MVPPPWSCPSRMLGIVVTDQPIRPDTRMDGQHPFPMTRSSTLDRSRRSSPLTAGASYEGRCSAFRALGPRGTLGRFAQLRGHWARSTASTPPPGTRSFVSGPRGIARSVVGRMARLCSIWVMVAGGMRRNRSGATAEVAESPHLPWPRMCRSGRPRSCWRQRISITTRPTVGGGTATSGRFVSAAICCMTGRSTGAGSG